VDLSNILKNMGMDTSKYFIQKDKSFNTMGIVASISDIPMCTFIDNEKYITNINSNVTMLITTKEISSKLINENYGICIAEDPRILFFKVHNYLHEDESYCRKKFATIIGENCKISDYSVISKNNVKIGNNVIIEELVSIKDNTVIGDGTIIRAGSIIGGEGFEFKRSGDSILDVKHLGGVLIGKNVEIQHNTCVDKAVYPWDDTIVGSNSKIDNLVHIAHAVKINNNTMVVALSGVGGRTVIGENSWIGFSTTVTNGIRIGRDSRVNMGAVVTRNVEDGQSVSGNFAIDHEKFIEFIKSIR